MTSSFTIEAVLDGIRPNIYRVFEIPGRYKLRQLHAVLQIIFGWWDYHLHQFEIDDQIYTDAETFAPGFDLGEEDEEIRLDRVLRPRLRFYYRYDVGDDWRVTLKVKSTRQSIPEDRPNCLEGRLADPRW